MNIEHLREFEYLAENLSFRDTARHFFVSPSVISRHISAMEDELGTKLFVRSKQSVAITDAGIDVNAYIGRSLSGRTLTACKEALASCQAYLEDFSVLENARVQWRARVSALY